MTKSSLITFRKAGSYASNITNKALDDIQRFFESKGVTEGTFDVFRGNRLRGNVGVVLRPYDGGNAINLNCRTRDDEFPNSYKIQPIGIDPAEIDAKLRQEKAETAIRLNVKAEKASTTCQGVPFGTLWREHPEAFSEVVSLIHTHVDSNGRISEGEVITALEIVYEVSTGLKANEELLLRGIESLKAKGQLEPYLNGHAGPDINAAIKAAREGGAMHYTVPVSKNGAQITSPLSMVEEGEFVESTPPSFLAKASPPKAPLEPKPQPFHQPTVKRSLGVKLTGKWNLRTIGAFNAISNLQVGQETTKEAVKGMIVKVWQWAEGRTLDETEQSYSLRMLVRTKTIKASKWNEFKAPTHYKVIALYDSPEDLTCEELAQIPSPPPTVQPPKSAVEIDIESLATESLIKLRKFATPEPGSDRGIHNMRTFAASIEEVMENHGINPTDQRVLDLVIAKLHGMRVVEEKYNPNHVGARKIPCGWYVYGSPQPKPGSGSFATRTSERVIPADKVAEYSKSKTRINEIGDEIQEIGEERETEIEALKSRLEIDIQRLKSAAESKMLRLKAERDALNQVVSGIEALARLG